MPAFTLSEMIAERIISDLRKRPELKLVDVCGIACYSYVNERGAKIRIQSIMIDGRKHPRFVVSVQPKDGKEIKLPPKYGKTAWNIANGETGKSGPRKRHIDADTLNDAASALGIQL